MLTTAQPLRIRQRTVETGTATTTLKSDRVPAGELWDITSWSVEDETSPFTSFRVYILTSGYKHYLKEQLLPAAATLYWDDEDLVLGEGEQLCVDCIGTISADAIQFLATGKRRPETEA